MMIIAIVVLGGAYLLYGRYLQNKWCIDPNAKTPAYEMEEGYDDRETGKGIPDSRAGSWKYITADFCRIASDPWCVGCNPGCKETS